MQYEIELNGLHVNGQENVVVKVTYNDAIPALEALRPEWGQLKYTVFTILTVTVGGTFSAFVYITLYTIVSKLLRLCFPAKQSELSSLKTPLVHRIAGGVFFFTNF